MIERDPTRAASCRPRTPLTPEELDAFRPKPAVTLDDEARRIAYKLGSRDFEPLVRRVLALEATNRTQATQILALQNETLRLKFARPTQG